MTRAARSRSACRKPTKTEYPAGYFTELVKANDWPPRFVSQIRVDPRTHRMISDNRANGGFDRYPLGLPGAVEYTKAWEASQAWKAGGMTGRPQ